MMNPEGSSSHSTLLLNFVILLPVSIEVLNKTVTPPIYCSQLNIYLSSIQRGGGASNITTIVTIISRYESSQF